MGTPRFHPWGACALAVLSLVACKHHDNLSGDDAGGDLPDACEGLQCSIVDCNAKGLPPTTVSGRVFAPNGTLPLYGVNVYVPASDPGALPDGAQCDRCASGLPGGALTQTITDEHGSFTLQNVPATGNVPLIIQTGKWRRKIMLPLVAACQDLPLAAGDTRLPKNQSEGDIPKIAISTGMADALECLVRKLGIDDSEFSTDGGTGRLHLYADPGSGGGQGANKFKAGFPGGTGNFADSVSLWTDLDKMKAYDVLIFSCEGGPHEESKSQVAMDAVKAYADFGGRVFLSHWHNVWVEGAAVQKPAVWAPPNGISTWNHTSDLPNGSIDVIDEVANPKGASFAAWMEDPLVMASTVHGEIPLINGTGQRTALDVDPAKGERWTYVKNGAGRTQTFQFTTPNEMPADQRCGKVVFSDMHVSGNSSSAPGTAFPDGCSGAALTPQEKALAFMFFDIASCVGQLF